MTPTSSSSVAANTLDAARLRTGVDPLTPRRARRRCRWCSRPARAGWCTTCAQLLDAAAAAAGWTLLAAPPATALDTACRVVADSRAAGAT
jgi:hypothetical protein